MLDLSIPSRRCGFVWAVYAISETKRGDALAASNYNADGTITIYVPKSAVGNPQTGDLLGAVNVGPLQFTTTATPLVKR